MRGKEGAKETDGVKVRDFSDPELKNPKGDSLDSLLIRGSLTEEVEEGVWAGGWRTALRREGISLLAPTRVGLISTKEEILYFRSE